MREMKDSGCNYLEMIPSSWSTSRLKGYFKVSRTTGRPDATVLSLYRDYGIVPKDSRSDNHNVTSLDTSKYKFVEVGDFVINKMKGWQGSMALSAYEGIVSPAYHVFKFTSPLLLPKYAHYLLRCRSYADEWHKLSTGLRVGQWDLHVEDFLNTRIPVPPLDEQRRIADYLDEKCAEIDRAVSAAERSIEELNLYRSARLEEVITRVSHEAPREKLKYVLKESKDKSPDGIGEPLSITIARGVLRSAELSIPNPTSSLVGAKIVHAGDLVFNKLKAYYGVMYVSPYNGLISPEYAVYRAIDMGRTSLKYLEYVFHTAAMIDEFIIRISGVADGFRRLYTSDLFDIAVPVPSIEVQQGIVAELDDLYASIFESTEAKQAVIADLKAYKQSLIYEVVTGKREV